MKFYYLLFDFAGGEELTSCSLAYALMGFAFFEKIE